jgi:hypothetical protein
MLKLLMLGLCCLAFSAHASKIVFDKEVSFYLQQIVNEGLNLLPDDYLASSRVPIEIEEVHLPSDKVMGEDLCFLDNSVEFGLTMSRRGRHKIQISSRLIQLAQKVERTFSCLHGTFERVLIATILHELTHVKDNSERLSLDPNFQRIVGMKKITRRSKKKVLNQNVAASPDAYEFKNLEEALAVNVEYMLLDDEFECRRPATANFLHQRLGLKLPGKCTKNYNVVVQSAYLEDNYLQSLSIDPSRVYQVHYLFAGKGKAIMSRWGHAMIRLIVCAPGRKTVGPDCLRDVSHHLVLSYRAHITDMNLSYRKGISGNYPSQLYLLRFHEVQQEYTKFELRDLYSIPLILTSEQKTDFIDLTLERFWSYQGKYYFLGNNCGTETQKHLAVALLEEQANLIKSITPSKMYRDIINIKSGLSQEGIWRLTRDQMIGSGMLIESLSKELNQYYQYLRSFGLFRPRKFARFLKKTSAEKRYAAYRDFFNKSELSPVVFKKMLMRLIYFERYLFSKFVMELPKQAMLKMNKDAVLKSEILKMGESMKTLGIQPWEVVNGHYGVPTNEEFAQQYPLFVDRRKVQMQASLKVQMENLQSILGTQHFTQELQEIENHQRIKDFMTDLFIKLNSN